MQEIKTNKRRAGVLAHVSSLAGQYSIGSLGESARRFVDRIAEAGFSLWQVLPTSPTDGHGSPYRSPASFGANPYLIDLPLLYEEGLITREELRGAVQREEGRVEFERLRSERLSLLRLAASRISDRTEVISYVDARPELSYAAYFMALRELNGGREWQRWDSFRASIDELYFRQFLEYKFSTQWQSVKEYASSRGVMIIGDVPMYVDSDSADVWRAPDLFLLDGGGYPSAVAGVPPDYFSADGQLWGSPLYRWEKMKLDGYAWWRRRIKHALSMYDGLRIDHFRAIEAYWSVPPSAKSAKDGEWQKGPGEELIRAIKDTAGERMIIAEDLGDITDAVRALLDYSGFPGMRVLQFGFPCSTDATQKGGADGASDGTSTGTYDSTSPHLPHNIPRHAVAYSGTHDNNTLIGFISALGARERARLAEYVGSPDLSAESIAASAIRALYASASDTVILPVQDILSLGAECRMNTPGVADGNWRYRMTERDLASFPTERYNRLAELYGR